MRKQTNKLITCFILCSTHLSFFYMVWKTEEKGMISDTQFLCRDYLMDSNK